MELGKVDIREIHWLMDMFQSIDVGIIVLDRQYRVHVWNGFMGNHSGQPGEKVVGSNIFSLFPEVPEQWFRRKVDSVVMLKSRAFTTWEQRPYVFRFKNYRPITGNAEFMYQSVSFIPLVAVNGEVDYIGVVIYDVTDAALSKRDVEAANKLLEVLSRTDRLTQLNNRGFWEECLEREFRRVRRTHGPATLIMFDIDHFKKINDTYGHPAGDEVIRNTSALMRQASRETDILGRYGGEEFGIILVDTAAEGAAIMADRLRLAIEASVVHHDGKEIRYTISLGVAELPENIESHKQWIALSDQGLYAAKHGGRNQVVVQSPTKK